MNAFHYLINTQLFFKFIDIDTNSIIVGIGFINSKQGRRNDVRARGADFRERALLN
jgi:hypothetical protein